MRVAFGGAHPSGLLSRLKPHFLKALSERVPPLPAVHQWLPIPASVAFKATRAVPPPTATSTLLFPLWEEISFQAVQLLI